MEDEKERIFSCPNLYGQSGVVLNRTDFQSSIYIFGGADDKAKTNTKVRYCEVKRTEVVNYYPHMTFYDMYLKNFPARQFSPAFTYDDSIYFFGGKANQYLNDVVKIGFLRNN
jgi:hypothetical protein